MQRVLLNAVTDAWGVLEQPPPSVITLAFDERGVQYWVRFFTNQFDKRDRVDSGVRDRIWYALNRQGIAIPPPLRGVAMHELVVRLAQERVHRGGSFCRRLRRGRERVFCCCLRGRRCFR